MSWKKGPMMAARPGQVEFPTYRLPKEHQKGVKRCCRVVPVWQSVTMWDDLVCPRCGHRAGCFDGEFSWVVKVWNQSIDGKKRDLR